MSKHATLYDGKSIKGINPWDPDSNVGWTNISGKPEDSTAAMLYSQAAYLNATINKRADGVKSIPRELTTLNGAEVEEDELPFGFDIADMLWRCSVALDLYGKWYLFKERNNARLLDVRWFHPETVTPKIDERRGLVGFDRTAGALKEFYPYDPKASMSPDLAWMWASGMQEIGPPDFALADVASDAANVLRAIDKMAGSFFTRGAISQHIFTAVHMPPESEKKRFLARLKRFLFGGIETANEVMVQRDGFTPHKLGSDPADLAMPELDADNRRDITAVLQTPEPLITGDAGGMSRATITQLTSSWIEGVIEPRTQDIVDAFNHHILMPAGYELTVNISGMNIDQESERQRALAFSMYVNSGVDPDTAAAMLGLDIPEGMELMSDDPPEPDPAPFSAPPEPDEDAEAPDDVDAEDSKSVEIGRLRRFVKAGRHLERPFQSDILTPLEIEAITAQEGATRDDAPFPDWQGYP